MEGKGELILRHDSDLFPRCELHEQRLIDGLPGGCPMRQPKPCAVIAELQNGGYGRLADGDTAGGEADLERAALCNQCIGQLMRNRMVRRWRAEAERERETEEVCE